MKPWRHAKNSARKWGGVAEDYMPIHDMMDLSKSAEASVKHRCIFHSAFGIFIIEHIFGTNIVNSQGKEVSVRDVAEQHVLEDLGTIPSLSDWLKNLPIESWMSRPISDKKSGNLFDVLKDKDPENELTKRIKEIQDEQQRNIDISRNPYQLDQPRIPRFPDPGTIID